jgi:predicted nucleic acid-binding protein
VKILVDTNVVLDLLLEREPFVREAAVLFSLVDTGKIDAYISAISVTTVNYLIGRSTNVSKANQLTELLMKIFEIAPVDGAVLYSAANNGFTDFEDGVIHESALIVNSQAIVTRNVKDFKKATIAVFTPVDFLKVYLSSTIG